jgi:hypothetical protein
MNSSIKIVRQIEELFRVITHKVQRVEGWRGGGSSSLYNVSAKKIKMLKNNKRLFLRGRSVIRGF